MALIVVDVSRIKIDINLTLCSGALKLTTVSAHKKYLKAMLETALAMSQEITFTIET